MVWHTVCMAVCQFEPKSVDLDLFK